MRSLREATVFSCVKLIVVRDGSAILSGEFGQWLRGSHPTPLVAQSQHHPAMAWEGVGQS